jgi:fatty acid synthase subunit beta
MLSISNIRQDQIERAVDGLNKHLPSDKHAHVALVNSVSNFVVSGPERTLAALIRSLQVASATDAQSQTRVPFSQRKPLPAIRFLPITIPCHCPLLDEAVPLIESDLGDSCSIQAKSLEIPVSQLQVGSGGNNADLTPFLVRMVTSEPVNWLESDFQGATHIVDFGPGLVNGVGSLTHRNLAGSGARVLVAGKLGSPSGELSFEPSFELGTLEELYSAKEGQVPRAPRWAQDEQVSLIRTSSGTMVSSKLSRLLGLPPVMVAGMTPTTTRPEFVAAVINAGYHVEFAAGGYHDAEWLKSALFRLRDLIPAGRGITLNVLYVAPKALAWQIPLIRQLRADGFPLTGMTVGAGVPSPSVATEYIDTLGLEHISFKPSSAASIRQVVEIARNRPTFPIILQWTGGRGGGHHSAEDMHAPILETYADIRSCPNLILVAGSGFGCAEDVIPYFTGSWSLARGRPYPMPFDGVLLGSRVMTCAEAFTSAGAKEAIAAVSGVEDRDWEGTYRGVAGGIISVVSEMGEPIHVIATRGAQLWAEMDKLVFSLDRKKRGGVLEKYKHYIISRLNADFQRPWFGIRADGTACDVSDMTYDAAARRLLSLMFVNGQRWIDKSHAGLLYRFLLRVEERFRTGDDGDESAAPESISSETDCQDTPTGAIKSVMLACPLATSTLLFHEDVDYFIQLCRRPGQKPVPFIPALDDHFETWFKKDSLWQSEDVDSVVGQDAGRTFILHGPVAARHTCKVDEPVGEVLDGINRGVVDHLMAAVHIAEGFPLPYEETVRRLSIPGPKGATPASSTPDGLIPVTMLKGGQLRLLLAGSSSTPPWRSALFGSRFVSRAHDIVENPVLKVVDSVSADTVELLDDSITFFKTLANGDTQPQVKISRQGREIEILLSTHVTPGNEPISLALKFEYRPEAPYAPIREVTEHRNGRVCAMYRQLWQAQEPTASCEGTFTVDVNRLKAFNRAIGYAKVHRHDRVPMDFGIVACWGPICAALLQDPVQGDVLNLVHLSNAYEVFGEHTPMAIGDVLETKALVRSITIEDSGKVVKIACQLRRAGAHMMTVRSAFLFRGNYTDFPSTFARTVEPRFELDITSETDIALLDTKPWFRLENKNVLDHLNLTELTLEFHLETSTTWLSKSTYATLDTAGVVYIRSEAGDLTRVGIVKHNATNCRDNIVLSYLRRWGRLLDHQQKHPLQGSGVSSSSASEQSCEICVPASNEAYSRASGDFNPIHTSPMFARLVGLPGTITHGMYSSAAVSQIVEKYAAGQNPDRIRRYDVSFTGMVLPGDVLDVSLRHSGMQAGAQVIDITATNTRTGDKALVGSALVSQPPTTVVFAGQGSQEQGMGMQLYASSPVARAVWDRADSYFESQFGLSIVNIVRYNPKEIKVHFGGVRGRMLRQNYLAMSYYEAVHTEGPTSPRLDRRPMFQTITQTSTSFTHSSPNGLLFSTQFAQPALTIMEMAAFKDMESRGIVDPNCHFAGHSLGEYAALASTTGFMSFENLLYTVFSRGMTMQNAVDRDDLGRSAFAMVAVDPSRVNKGAKLTISTA